MSRSSTVTPAAFVPERAIVPYDGGERLLELLEPGSWQLTIVGLDGFGGVRDAWELATVELRAGAELALEGQ